MEGWIVGRTAGSTFGPISEGGSAAELPVPRTASMSDTVGRGTESLDAAGAAMLWFVYANVGLLASDR